MEQYITISDLKKISSKLFKHLELLNIDKIKIAHDYYWYIPPEEKYKPEKNPKDLSLGQLSDDLRDIKDLLKEEYDPIVHNFLDLAPILAHIGEKDETDLIKESKEKGTGKVTGTFDRDTQ